MGCAVDAGRSWCVELGCHVCCHGQECLSVCLCCAALSVVLCRPSSSRRVERAASRRSRSRRQRKWSRRRRSLSAQMHNAKNTFRTTTGDLWQIYCRACAGQVSACRQAHSTGTLFGRPGKCGSCQCSRLRELLMHISGSLLPSLVVCQRLFGHYFNGIVAGAGAARFPLDPQPNWIGCVAWCFLPSACVAESWLLRKDSLPV